MNGELVAMEVVALLPGKAMVNGIYKGYSAKEYTWEMIESNKEGVTLAGHMGFRGEGNNLVGEMWKVTKKGEHCSLFVFRSCERAV